MLHVRAAATICLSLGLSVPTMAQQPSAEPKILEINSSGAGVMSWRRVETQTTSGDTTVVTTAVQTPGIEGRWQTRQETTTETIANASGTTHVTQHVYTIGTQGERVLHERTESNQARLRDNTVQSVSQTWTADVNGRLGLLANSIEERRADAGVSESSTRVFVAGVDGRLTESARTTHNEKQVSPSVVRHDSTVMYRDLNGAWQPVETRQSDERNTDSAGHLEEETVSRPDINGVMGISERNVTRRSVANGREDVLIERYVPRDPGAVHRSPDRMELNERIRVSTTIATDGTRETIEEVEGRNPQAAGDPMRVRQRTVTTVRPLGGDRSAVERQTFDLDANGRLVLTATERREGSAP